MVIQHNMASMFAHRQLGITTGIMAKSSEKLSSGYRINRAADDAAGLAISEKMRRQIRGLGQNMENIQDGISFVQVADGYLNEVHDMLQRISELSIKGANGTLTSSDRGYIDTEVQAIKDEIERIFKTATFNDMHIFKIPYSPTVEPDPEPYDMQVFYSTPGVVGGLEFNNVRYNMSELTAKGLSLDENGKATEDQTIEFELNDANSEKVTLLLNKGDSLTDVKRQYDWKADNTGISVNNVAAATWSQLGISGNGKDAGTYSFSFHGSKITFEVEDGDSLDDIIKGINGDSITEPSHWEISQASATNRRIVSLPSNVANITVTEANKHYADDKYEIVATAEDGLSIKRTDKYNTSETSQTSSSAWGGFKNVATNPITRVPAEDDNGGYPIVDWGLDNDSNDSSQITFDTDALYHYENTLNSMTIKYDFKLADVASRSDIVSTFDGTNLGGSVTPGRSTLNSSDSSKLTLSNGNITNNNENAFVMQRAYGRNFNTNDDLNGNISWSATPKSADFTEYGNVTRTNPTDSSAPDVTTTNSGTYYYKDENDRIWEVSGEQIRTTVSHKNYIETHHLYKNYDITVNGSLGDSTMKEQQVIDHRVDFTNNKSVSYDETSVQVFGGIGRVLSEDEWNTRVGEGATLESGPHVGSYSTSNWSSEDHISVNSGTYAYNSTYLDSNETNASNTALGFTYRISNSDIVKNNAGGSTNFTLSFRDNAVRSFNPNLPRSTVPEYDFMNIVTVPPKKEMIIQATPNSPLEEQIAIQWSALNLSVIGMTGANTLSQEAALGSIELTKAAMNRISLERTGFGAAQNRLEHAYNYTANARENTQHSESIIRDTEMNAEIMRLRNTEILAQAGQAMLAQANQSKNGVLSLLQ